MNQHTYTDEQKKISLEQLERGILDTVNTLSELNIMIENFTSDSEATWFFKLNKLVENYNAVKNVGRAYDVPIPPQVIDHIDNGTSPSQFMSTVQQSAIERCDVMNGRNDVFQVLLDSIKQEIGNNEEFAEELKTL
ncbi:mediator of RNA polymerase II transcription subunit 10b [Acrasis kona]|uniref:Mediator of RNA polymerase II transcription subunit 10 n=1 Tax=Acrasis kona TaxID=1008807 RepID=A0AAW2ZG38_9EUKA